MSESFDVSVIIPVFNGKKYLRHAVQSVLNEGLSQVQILVIDDGSTDDSLATIDEFPVEKIRLSFNQGVSAARNVGLRAARGRYVTFLDADDLLCPGGLRWRMRWLRKHPTSQALGGRPAGIIDEQGYLLSGLEHVLHRDYKIPKQLTLDFFRQGGAYPVAMWNFIFEADLLEKVGFFDESLRLSEDFDYLLRVLARTSIPVVPLPVVYRRLHEANISVERKDGHYVLRQENIRQAQSVLDRLGVHPTEWNPWETGYK